MLLDGIWTRIEGDPEQHFVGQNVARQTTNWEYQQLGSNSMNANGREPEEKELVKSWDLT